MTKNQKLRKRVISMRPKYHEVQNFNNKTKINTPR